MTAKFLTGVLIHIGAKAMLLLLSILLARSLGAQGYGDYVYAVAIASILATLAQAGAPQLILRDVAVAHDTGDRVRTALIVKRGLILVSVLSLITICFAATVFAWRWHSGSFTADQGATYASMLVLFPLIVLVTMGAHILRGFDRIRTSQLIELWARPLLMLILVAATFWLFPAWRLPQSAIIVQVAACLLTLVVIGLLFRRLTTSGWLNWRSGTASQWLSLLKSLLPFASISIAMSVQAQADIIMLGFWMSSEHVGIYRVASQGAALVAFSLPALNMIFAARIAAFSARSDKAALQLMLTRIARLAFASALPLAVVLIFYGGTLAGLVFGEQFEQSANPLAILAASQLLNVAFGAVGTLLLMSGYEQESARALWTMVVVNVVLNMLLIPAYGLIGAASATAISIVLWNALLYLTVRSKMRLNPTVLSAERT